MHQWKNGLDLTKFRIESENFIFDFFLSYFYSIFNVSFYKWYYCPQFKTLLIISLFYIPRWKIHADNTVIWYNQLCPEFVSKKIWLRRTTFLRCTIWFRRLTWLRRNTWPRLTPKAAYSSTFIRGLPNLRNKLWKYMLQ